MGDGSASALAGADGLGLLVGGGLGVADVVEVVVDVGLGVETPTGAHAASTTVTMAAAIRRLMRAILLAATAASLRGVFVRRFRHWKTP